MNKFHPAECQHRILCKLLYQEIYVQNAGLKHFLQKQSNSFVNWEANIQVGLEMVSTEQKWFFIIWIFIKCFCCEMP